MTHVIVCDASCLIDLQKGELLNFICDLPYRIAIPLPLRESELRSVSACEWKMLDDAGTITYDLSADEINRSRELKIQQPSLSAKDCICLVTAQSYSGKLLTGDSKLREVAKSKGIQVYGALWVTDELHSNEICSNRILRRALKVWNEDKAVFLPEDEISSRLNKWK